MPIDRTRQFSLPDAQDLSKDQEEALALPLEGQHLIVGGPGTGKSVVALLRARQLAAQGKKYRLLVHNRTLNASNRHLFGGNPELVSDTWDGWFRARYKRIFKKKAPTLAKQANGYEPLDWEAVQASLANMQNAFSTPWDSRHFLIIDEGQDMPPAFYRALISMGVENFYVLADQNQKLEPEQCSSRREIKSILCVQRPLELTSNHRNTRPIARLAQHFYPDDPASPRPELPQETPSAQTPLLLQYADEQKMARYILQYSDRHPAKLVGVITQTDSVRGKFLRAIGATQKGVLKLDNGLPPVQTYPSRKPLDFTRGGIMVINAQSCKGLEFDTAILADIDQCGRNDDEYQLKSRLYVMAARAREQLIMLRTGAPDPVIEKLLPPEDSGLLVRKVS